MLFSISDLLKAQTLGRCGVSCILPVEGGENVGYGVRSYDALADLEQRTDDDAHHVVQKSVAGDCEADLVTDALDTQQVNVPDGGALHVL